MSVKDYTEETQTRLSYVEGTNNFCCDQRVSQFAKEEIYRVRRLFVVAIWFVTLVCG